MPLDGRFYDNLLKRAARQVLRRAENRVVVLVPPGSSRHALAGRLDPSQVYTYSTEKLPGSKPIEELLRLLELGRAHEALKGGLCVVIPRDTTSALKLRGELQKAGTPVEVIFLPRLYRRILEKAFRKEPPKYAQLNYSGIGLGRGVSLALLRKGLDVGEMREAIEAIKGLAPRRPGIVKRVHESGGKVATASLATALALLDPQLNFIETVSLVATEAWKRGLDRFLEDAVSIVRQAGGRELLTAVLNLLRRVEQAARYIDREELEGVVDEVATKLGLGVEELRSFVKSLAALAREGTAAEERIEELRKRLEVDLDGELEKLREAVGRRIKELESRLEELEKSLEVLGALLRHEAVHKGEGGMAGLGFTSDLEKLLIHGEEYALVRGEEFERYAVAVESLLFSKGLAVIKGARGIGKSVLARYVAARYLRGGGAARELPRVRRIYRLRRLDRDATSVFLHLVAMDPLARFSVLILYDPSPPVRFGGQLERGVLEKISATLRELVRLRKAGFSVLVSIPSDLWHELDPDLRSVLKEAIVEVELCDRKFLEEMLRVYSRGKIPEDKLEELAGKILKFEEGCAVAAALMGKTVAEGGGVEGAERLIEEARGSALALIVHYLNALFGVKPGPQANALAEVLALRKPFVRALRPGDSVVPPGLVKLAAKMQLSEKQVGFLTVRHHDLIEEAVTLILEPQRASDVVKRALEPWGRGVRPAFKNEAEAISYFLEQYGYALREALSKHDGCWPRLAMLLGHALAEAPLLLRHDMMHQDVERELDSALKPCDVDSYFLANNVIAPFSMHLVLELARRGQLLRMLEPIAEKHYGEIIREAERLVKAWRERGASEAEVFYTLGLAAAASAVERRLDDSAAGVVLQAALPAVQQVSSADAAGAILGVLRPLGWRAEELYASMLAKVLMRGPPPDVLRTVYAELLRVYGNWLYELRETWPLALATSALMRVIADVAELRADAQAVLCLLLKALQRHIGDAALFVEAHALFTALAAGLPACGGADAAERAKELLESLEKFDYERALYSSVYKKFLLSRGWEKPEAAVRTEVDGAKARLLFGLALHKFWSGNHLEAETLFKESARIFKGLGDQAGYLTAHDYALRSSILSAGSLDELREAARSFEELWDTARGAPLVTLARPAARSVLCHYLVYLATAGKRSDLDGLLKRYRHLLLKESRGALCLLMLRVLGVDVEKPEELLEAVRLEVLEGLLDYLERRLEPNEERPHELSLTFGIDEEISDLISVGDKGDQLAGAAGLLSRAYLARQLAPGISKILLALILHALNRGNSASAKRFAQRATRSLGTQWPAKLFREVHETCCGGDAFKLTLLKLYYALL